MSLLAWAWFVDPAPVWSYWYLLLLPLTAAISVVYKSVKCQSMKRVPREAAALSLWILLSMIAAAAVLLAVVKLVERAQQ